MGAADDPLGRYLLGFGEDEDGEIYVLTSTNLAPIGAAGEVFRLGVVPEPGSLLLSALGGAILLAFASCRRKPKN